MMLTKQRTEASSSHDRITQLQSLNCASCNFVSVYTATNINGRTVLVGLQFAGSAKRKTPPQPPFLVDTATGGGMASLTSTRVGPAFTDDRQHSTRRGRVSQNE